MRSVIPVLLFVALGVGCRSSHDASEPQATTQAVAPTPGAAPQAQQQTPLEIRKVVRTASLTLDVPDLEAARQKAVAIAEGSHGFVASSHTDEGQDNDLKTISITVRVPAETFEQVLQKFRALGFVRSDRTSAQDVTANHVDLAAHLTAKRALEERVLALLKDVKSVKDALEVERELANIRKEIETIEGQKILLERQSAMSTIEVSLRREEVRVVASVSSIWDSLERARIDALNTAGMILTAMIRALGVLFPLAVIFGMPILLALAYSRRAKRDRAEKLTPVQ